MYPSLVEQDEILLGNLSVFCVAQHQQPPRHSRSNTRIHTQTRTHTHTHTSIFSLSSLSFKLERKATHPSTGATMSGTFWGQFHQRIYSQLLCTQILEAQKRQSSQAAFCTFRICGRRS